MLKKSVALFFYAIYSASSLLNAAVVIEGDQEDPTFSFPIGVYTTASNDNGVCLFTGAGNTSGGDYTIAKLDPMARSFRKLSPEEIKLGNDKVTNPFRDSEISLMTAISKSAVMGPGDFAPVFVTADDRKTLYLIDMVYSDGSIKAVKNSATIVDASLVNETDGMVALSASNTGIVFAAVRANGETSYGTGNSGVAVFGVADSAQVGDETVKGPFLIQNFTTLMNTASSFLVIGSDLADITDVVDMHWDSRIERLFVGLQVTGGAAGTDGARAVAVGRIVSIMIAPDQFVAGLMFEPIAPDAAFDDTTKIVGAVGADVQLSINKVRTMHVSNTFDNRRALNLSYLIVQGGVGTPAATRNSVFALPLVCSGAAAEIGTLANKDSTIVDGTVGRDHPMRVSHCFNQAATMPSELFTDADLAARVGGGDLAEGDIEEIYILNDTVFVSVGDANPNFKPGIFYSRAILDETDAIVAWTEWQRFASITENVFGFFTDDLTGQTGYLNGADAATVDTVKYTLWGNGSSTLSAPLLNTLGGFEQGGIQGFADFPQNTPGLNDEVALLITTGRGRVIIGQSGNNETGAFCPTQGEIASGVVQYQDGAIDAMPPAGTRLISIGGGALDTVGSIVAAEIANQSDNGRLFVGGVNGLAVLVDDSGDGWGASGIGIDFEGLTAGMAFKTIGNYSFVQKIISDGDFVYVLTLDKLDRIDVGASDFATGTLSVVTVADVRNLLPSGTNGALCDVAISEKFCVLATSFGLLRVGNGANIQTASNTEEVNWVSVEVPFSVGPGYALQAVSTTGRAQGFANGAPGNIYLLTADLGNNRARINRYAVEDVNGAPVSATTIQPLSDVFQEDVTQYFFNPGNLIQQFATDGALTLLGANRNLFINPMVYSTRLSIPLGLARANRIVALQKNSASGSQLVVTDAGIFTDE